MKRDEHAQILLDELQRHGFTGWLERRTPHSRTWYRQNGRDRFYVIPNSMGETRCGVENSLRDLRHQLGVKRKVYKSRKPKRRRNQTEEPALPSTITPGRDPFADLRGYVDAMPEPDDFWQWIEWRAMRAENRILRSVAAAE